MFLLAPVIVEVKIWLENLDEFPTRRKPDGSNPDAAIDEMSAGG